MSIPRASVPAPPGGGKVLTSPVSGTMDWETPSGTSFTASSANNGKWLRTVAGAFVWSTITSADVSGLGSAATLNVGTATNTVAAGDDSRIIGAAQKSANLSDVTAATARTNLGLGGAAVLNVGTTVGTLAAGNDSRFGLASDRFDVTAYGAVGDGTTNDQAAIQAALDAVPATGGVVYFPMGKYKINTAITPKALTILLGAHPGGSQDGGNIITIPDGAVIIAGVGMASMVNITNIRGVQLQNLGIHGKSLATTCVACDGYGHGSRIENCVISGATTQNVYVIGTTNYNGEFHVLNSQLTMNGAGYNILCDATVGTGGAGDMMIDGNLLRGAALADVRSIGGGGNMITRNHCYANPATQTARTCAVWLDSVGHDQILSNYFDQTNGGPGVKVTSGVGGTQFAANVNISLNQFFNLGITSDNTHPAILLDATAGGKVRSIIINGNQAMGASNTLRYNYFIQSASPTNVIATTANGNTARWAAAMWNQAPDAHTGNILSTGSPETITVL